MPYNPFSKPIGTQLELRDLEGLIGKVPEGYFVEFKRDFPANYKIAHSIASLANTFGGWYIVGVETDDQDHLAKEVCGFKDSDYPDPIAKIRDICSSRIDPAPTLYPLLVRVDEPRSALAVYVPPNQRTPFITSDGRIYRRNHDSSEPVKETRRHTLDFLVEQGKKAERRFSEFMGVENSRQSGIPGDDTAWLNVYLMPEPAGLLHRPSLLSTDGARDLLALSQRPRPVIPSASKDITGNVPFHHVQVTHQSVQLRQMISAGHTGTSVTAEFFPGGSARFHIPVKLADAPTAVEMFSNSPEVEPILLRIIEEDPGRWGDALHLRFFEASQVLLVLALLLGLHRDLYEVPETQRLRFGYSLRGFWDAVPVIPIKGWQDQVTEWNLPVLRSDVTVPDSEETSLTVDAGEDGPWYPILAELLYAFGLREELMGKGIVQSLMKHANV